LLTFTPECAGFVVSLATVFVDLIPLGKVFAPALREAIQRALTYLTGVDAVRRATEGDPAALILAIGAFLVGAVPIVGGYLAAALDAPAAIMSAVACARSQP
jgi:hypothetical protein